MTATTERATTVLEEYLDLYHNIQPGITITAAAVRLACNPDNLRRWLVAAHQDGDTRIPADVLPKAEPDRPSIKAEEATRRKTWTPFHGDRKLKRAAAWTCCNNAADAPELERFLSMLGLTPRDAR